MISEISWWEPPQKKGLTNQCYEYAQNPCIYFSHLCVCVLSPESISSSQALLLLRCCGTFIYEELPATRTQKAHKIWDTLQDIG